MDDSEVVDTRYLWDDQDFESSDIVEASSDLSSDHSVTLSSAFGGDSVPWHKVQDHADCSSATPWAVVKDSDGAVEGCHATEQDADDQIAALYASEKDQGKKEAATAVTTTFSGDTTFPTGYRRMPDGSSMSEDDIERESQWAGTLVVEGITSGDGREFAKKALTWADLPVPLRWSKESSHGGDHNVTVQVGNIEKIKREGEKLRGSGRLDLMSADGFEVWRRMKDGFGGGISIDADDIGEADIEFIWPEADESVEVEEDELLISMLFGTPEKVIFHAGRIRGATMCDIPAFVEARIELTGGELVAAAVVETLGATAVHETSTSDQPWDGAVNEQLLNFPLPVGTARDAYAWIDEDAVENDEVAHDGCQFIHHEVGDDGQPGPANLTACSAGIGILNGGRGGTNVPDKQGVYDHLAAHLRDAGQEPPPADFNDEPLVASVSLLDEWRPNPEWFQDPQLNVPIGITITDQGRVYGHAALWGECHIGFEEQCVTPPHEDHHPYFMTGEVVCADGSRVAVGQITVGTGHAPLSYRATRAAEHYDNTGNAVADVTIGNDSHGIWVAGAIRPHAEAQRVHELRASGCVSGDWRRIGGSLRLVGLLAVNVGGFLVPKLRARVASGMQMALIAAGQPRVVQPVIPTPSEEELNNEALRRVMSMLVDRVSNRK